VSLPTPAPRSTADERIRACVELLRAMHADGFSVPVLVEVALGPDGLTQNRADEELPFIRDLYREAIGEIPRRPGLPAVAPEPVDPAAPVFANFMLRWPGAMADSREQAARAWRALTAADQARAIAFIDRWHAARRSAGQLSRVAACRYLSDRPWAAA
jgi:hypothetical protein